MSKKNSKQGEIIKGITGQPLGEVGSIVYQSNGVLRISRQVVKRWKTKYKKYPKNENNN